MTTQPQLVICVSSPHHFHPRVVGGTEFRFIRIRPHDVFGTTDHWVNKNDKVVVSDLEKTVIDGLKQPEYCGGITEVAKGLWMRHNDMVPKRLVDYAVRLNIKAIMSRLGYLLEVFCIGTEQERNRLKKRLGKSYHLFDPILPSEGHYLSRWKLRLNVTSEEIEAVART